MKISENLQQYFLPEPAAPPNMQLYACKYKKDKDSRKIVKKNQKQIIH